MAITILYFAWIKEKTGTGQESVSPPESVETVADLIEWLSKRGNGYQSAFADLTLIRAAKDQEHVSFESRITGATEIAFFPPVTGG